MNVRLTKAQQIKVLNSQDLYGVMQRVLLREHKIDRDKEHFWIIGLAANNTLLYIELISLGSNRATAVDPMDVFSIALQKRSVKLVLVHNHPGGSLQPSAPDMDITDRLIQTGNFLEVPVLDHLIITATGYYSFLDSGLLAQLAKSKKYILPYKEQERLLAEAKAIGVKEGEKKGEQKGRKAGLKAGREAGKAEGREAERLQMAAVLKAKGVAVGVIAEVTGLSLAKVKGLKAAAAKRPNATKRSTKA